jgi:predicted GNAT family acetyltransferase
MESSGQTANVTVAVPLDRDNRWAYEELRSTYEDEEHARDGVQPSRSNNPKVFLALNLGEPVGFLESIEASASSGDLRRFRPSLKLEHIFVVEYMRGSGITQHMIRTIIDFARQNRQSSVWFDAIAVKPKIRQRIFVAAGFVEAADHQTLSYSLDYLTSKSRNKRGEAIPHGKAS